MIDMPRRPVLVFIVRVWQEPRAVPGLDPVLRGTVSELTGERRYSFSTATALHTAVDRVLVGAGLLDAQPDPAGGEGR